MSPEWRHALALASVSFGVAAAVLVALDILTGRPQPMRIMAVVWPITALWGGPVGLLLYGRIGRAARVSGAPEPHPAGDAGRPETTRAPITLAAVARATTHCGGGCTLGDLVAAPVFLAAPFTVLGQRLFASWVDELVAAFVLGIAFQYFGQRAKGSTMSRLTRAAKTDALSLAAWQVGMYGWMAIVTFGIVHADLSPTSVEYWFFMQAGMLAGFFTAFPVNAILLQRGIKEAM
jgi:hypothetical protein